MEVNSALLIANWVLFLLVTGYAVFLFGYLVLTRIQFIKLGKKAEFEKTMQERLQAIW